MSKLGVVARSDEIALKGTNARLSDWQHPEDPASIDGAKLRDGSVSAAKLGANEVFVRALACQIEAKTGLPADSTGVKAVSPRFTFSAKGVKALRLRSSITAIPGDATVRVGVYNVSTGSYLFYRDYEGATGEYEDVYTGTMPSDGDVLEIRVEVITASGTSGATFDLGYASLMVDIGYS